MKCPTRARELDRADGRHGIGQQREREQAHRTIRLHHDDLPHAAIAQLEDPRPRERAGHKFGPGDVHIAGLGRQVDDDAVAQAVGAAAFDGIDQPVERRFALTSVGGKVTVKARMPAMAWGHGGHRPDRSAVMVIGSLAVFCRPSPSK